MERRGAEKRELRREGERAPIQIDRKYNAADKAYLPFSPRRFQFGHRLPGRLRPLHDLTAALCQALLQGEAFIYSLHAGLVSDIGESLPVPSDLSAAVALPVLHVPAGDGQREEHHRGQDRRGLGRRRRLQLGHRQRHIASRALLHLPLHHSGEEIHADTVDRFYFSVFRSSCTRLCRSRCMPPWASASSIPRYQRFC